VALLPGTRLGPYDIVGPLGAGGMGEVYRARDSKLHRDVALKILPAAVVTDVDRLARFRREAQVLASLNHPGIAAIYGFEDSGGTHALVLELVEGQTLAERIAHGPIAPAEALPMARQIAEALEAAHELGIVHRDLKPANIKIRPDGTVKVLDFGLAKASDPSAGSNADAMNSPTLTTPAMTQAGMILGTAAYMAPEQARGRTVDKRADVWAFGAVLFEMLTGARAFPGEDLADTLAAVVRSEPEWALLPRDLPATLVVYLKRCLRKDPKQRIADMASMRLAIEGAFDVPVPAPATARHTERSFLWLSSVIAVVSLGIAASAVWNRPAAAQQPSIRLTIPLQPGAELTSYPAITRDGRTVAYVARQGTGDALLYLRDLDSFETRTVAGSRGARQPFFSPDGKWVAFFAQSHLQKVEVAGGTPVRLVEVSYALGGTWTEDNTIVYAASLGSGLLQVPAAGGTPRPVTKPDGAGKGYAHVWPQALPGGKVLFTVWGQKKGGAVLSLDTGQWDMVLPSTTFASAIFDTSSGDSVRSGRLLLVDAAGGLRAAPFDPRRPALTSADASVLDNVYSDISTESRGWLATSDTGTAVYASGNPSRTSLVWVDREGRIEPLRNEPDVYQEVSISPDGTRAVVRQSLDLWVHDLVRGTHSPLTSSTDSNILPAWSRDGRHVLFASNRGGDWDIYSQPADGSGAAERLLKRPHDQFPYMVALDGTLVYTEVQPVTGRDLWTLSPDGKASPLRVTRFNELAAQFSPTTAGAPRWVAYSSDESGQSEIYVQSFPGDERRVLVSPGGGIRPMWSPDGKELYYAAGDAMMAVALKPNGEFSAPRRLFDRSRFLINDRFQSYSVSPDGRRFLMIERAPDAAPRQLNVILNWSAAQTSPGDGR
jgi:Tol biopolymer transport system component/tRNA A-37 threonylcarbamoyl transferase component Bud32